jgi:iron complex transport system ATP-binding protein
MTSIKSGRGDDLLSVRDLAFGYSGDGSDIVFEDVSFSVSSGQVFCLLGPNGTGKSTLLKCVCNVLRGWKGTVTLDNESIERMTPSSVARLIGFVPQNQTSTFPFLVKDVVVMGRNPHLSVLSSPGRKDRSIASRAMETVGVLSLAERPCTTLSGGEWQLVLIARALAQQPRIMILDEPTSHLDMGNQMRILGVVRELASEGLAIVMASHFPDHAFMIATDVAILNHRHLMAAGSPDAVLTDERMRETYGIDIKVLRIEEGIDRKACFPSLPSPEKNARRVKSE